LVHPLLHTPAAAFNAAQQNAEKIPFPNLHIIIAWTLITATQNMELGSSRHFAGQKCRQITEHDAFAHSKDSETAGKPYSKPPLIRIVVDKNQGHAFWAKK